MPKPSSDQPESQVTPNPDLEKRSRRQFSKEYKLRIIAEADACQHGELGQLLRREKLYSSQLQQWRRDLADSNSEAEVKTAPGPAASQTPEQKRIEQLEKENARLNEKLQVAEDCIDLQKKTLAMIDHMSNGSSA
jgi:transposase-like protein